MFQSNPPNTMNKKTPPNTAAIKSLKNQGYSVKIKHFRRKAFKDKDQPLIADSTIRALKDIFPDISYGIVSQTGGATEIVLEKEEQKIIVRADCYAKDHFCKRLGLRAALDKLKKLYDIEA